MTTPTPRPSDPAVSAPEAIRFCPRCAAMLGTRTVGDKLRKYCHACRYVHFVEPRVGVGVMVVEGGRLLLVQRAKAPEKGKWCLPAGFLDLGEQPRAVAAREAEEETGLIVAVEGLVDVFSNPIGQGASVFLLFRARRVGGALQAGDDASDVAFFAPHALPEIAFASTRAAVAALAPSSASANPAPAGSGRRR